MLLLLKIVLGALTAALVYATSAPLTSANLWWVRIFDFPRLQLAVVMALVLGGYGTLRWWAPLAAWEYLFPTALTACLLWQIWAIAPYTPIVSPQVVDCRVDRESTHISLLICNVLYNNRQSAKLLDLIRETNPDVVLLTEANEWWKAELEPLGREYPHIVFQPQKNHYGMLLHSRLELIDPKVRYLVNSNIPSIRTQLRLRSGQVVTLYGLHPPPPGLIEPGEDVRQDSDKRDGELMIVAREVAALGDAPVVVVGDFNDVAWSRSTHLFQRIGGLLDPRVGRGFYNTFDATKYVLRYPLDHVFVSPHFRLVELRRLRNVGSDHFPMLAHLDFDPAAVVEHEAPPPKPGDQEQAQEIIDEVR